MAEMRRKFDAQFREGAVRLVAETGKPIESFARNVFQELAEHIVDETTGEVAHLRDYAPAVAAARDALDKAELRQVAEIYRANVDSSPVQAIEAILGLTRRTASRRIRQARDAGLLPPTTPGKKQA